MLNLLKAERIKLKRSPVFLAFLIMPVIPALLGTLNYNYHIEILTEAWYSLWTQHTIFTCYFFLPIMVGIYCAYLMRLEHANANWGKILALPVKKSSVFIAKLLTASAMVFLSEVWISALFIISGKIAALPSPPPYADIAIYCIFGTLGGMVMASIQLFLSIFIKSFAMPIGIAFAGGLSGLVCLTKGYGHIWPYSLMAYGMNSNSPQELIKSGYAFFIIICIVYIALFTILGCISMSKREL